VGFLLGQKLKLQNHDDDELDHELYDPWDNLDPDDGDELIALGIQSDKDKIKELEAKAKTLEERVCTCAAKDMPFGRCCKSD